MNLPSPRDTRIHLEQAYGPTKRMLHPLPLSGLLDFDDPEPGAEFDDDEDVDDNKACSCCVA